jgi:hypothetical protein
MVRLLLWEGICCLILNCPSLHRLQAEIDNPAFSIVTANVGENRARIARFIERFPLELPLLMGLGGKVSTDWKIYVYPSSYLVDHQGNYATLTWEHSNGIQRKL